MILYKNDPLRSGSKDQERAKELLLQECYTLVLCRGDITHTDTRRGIRPLLDLWEQGTTVQGFSAADKVVGKAAAFLYALLQMGSVHAQVISQPALDLLIQAGIPVTYETLVTAIKNRTNTGFCPMETAVWDAADPQDALCRIQDTLQTLST